MAGLGNICDKPAGAGNFLDRSRLHIWQKVKLPYPCLVDSYTRILTRLVITEVN